MEAWIAGRAIVESRFVNANGYAVVTLQGLGQYPEHRLVVVKKLGRPLRKGESVHHMNGQRADNREENLELWVGARFGGQPSGVRASDVVCPKCGTPYLPAVVPGPA